MWIFKYFSLTKSDFIIFRLIYVRAEEISNNIWRQRCSDQLELNLNKVLLFSDNSEQNHTFFPG